MKNLYVEADGYLSLFIALVVLFFMKLTDAVKYIVSKLR